MAEIKESGKLEFNVLALVSVGGVIGSLARYEAGLIWPTRTATFPWTTLWINVIGSALIGVVIVFSDDVFRSRFPRPFLATGILGGFTTFSAYTVDSERLFRTGHSALAAANIVITLAAALAAVASTTWATRQAVRRWAHVRASRSAVQ